VGRTLGAAVLGAAAISAALGLTGCTQKAEAPAAAPVTLTPVTTQPGIPLPPPEALVDVMVRLTDPDVAGADKVRFIQYATPEDAGAIDRFDKALADGGYRPLTFEANDIQWSAKTGGNVLTNLVIKTANPQAGDGSNFTFPMEFIVDPTGWQLTRDSADMLLQYDGPVPSDETAPPPLPPSP
jgi:hypothetical protein